MYCLFRHFWVAFQAYYPRKIGAYQKSFTECGKEISPSPPIRGKSRISNFGSSPDLRLRLSASPSRNVRSVDELGMLCRLRWRVRRGFSPRSAIRNSILSVRHSRRLHKKNQANKFVGLILVFWETALKASAPPPLSSTARTRQCPTS